MVVIVSMVLAENLVLTVKEVRGEVSKMIGIRGLITLFHLSLEATNLENFLD